VGINRELVSFAQVDAAVQQAQPKVRAPDCASKQSQENVMEVNLKLNKAAPGTRGFGRFIGTLAGLPLLATLAFCAPDRALAACGASHPAGVHAAVTGANGVHVATSRTATTSAGSGGSGTLGCASGSSATALRGLPVATSGRVMESGSHAAHATTNSRNAAAKTTATKTTNASAHLRGVKSPHHA
jgi:hypothetical protein